MGNKIEDQYSRFRKGPRPALHELSPADRVRYQILGPMLSDPDRLGLTDEQISTIESYAKLAASRESVINPTSINPDSTLGKILGISDDRKI